MARETSVEAYKQCVEEGLLSKRRAQVYAALYKFGPCTANELYKQMALRAANLTQSNVTTRLGELRDVGTAKEVGKVICSVTKRQVIQWDVTKNLPKKTSKKPTKTQIIATMAELITDVLAALAKEEKVNQEWQDWSEEAYSILNAYYDLSK